MKAVTIVSALAATITIGTFTTAVAQDPPQQPPATFASRSISSPSTSASSTTTAGRSPVSQPTTSRSKSTGAPAYRLGAVRIALCARRRRLRRPKRPTARTPAAGGRLIMFVVDRGNIAPGRGRQAMEAARRFLSRLIAGRSRRAHRVPRRRPAIDFTVQPRGRAERADRADRTDRHVSDVISHRHFGGDGDRAGRSHDAQHRHAARMCAGLPSPEERDLCMQAGRDRFATASTATSTSARRQHSSTLRAILDRLSHTSTPKTIVYISEGLVLERPGDGAWLGRWRRAARSRSTRLQLEVSASDASTAREPSSPGATRRWRGKGSASSPASTRGTVLPVLANADCAFERLALELSGYYLLSFEPESGDRDGKPHKIKVAVPRRRASTSELAAQFSIEAPASRTEDAVLKETLQAPMLANDIGLKLTTYTLRDPASDKLRILMAAEIDRTGNPTAVWRSPTAWSTTRAPRSTARSIGRSRRRSSRDGASRLHGLHPQRRHGHPHAEDRRRRRSRTPRQRRAFVPRGAHAARRVRATDILIADERTGTGSAAPVVGGEFTSGMVDRLHRALLRCRRRPEEHHGDVRGRAGRAGARARRRRRQGATGDGRFAEPPRARGNDSAGASAAGRLRRCAPSSRRTGGRSVRSRARSASGRTAAAASKAKPKTLGTRMTSRTRSPIPVASRTDRFERASVLTPQVVGFFVERLNVGARGESNPGPSRRARARRPLRRCGQGADDERDRPLPAAS